MKAIILCAGKSTRTWPLTATKPKPLLRILDKSILIHNLDQLKGLITEAVLVVGFMQARIKEHVGKEYKGIKITYVEQKEQHGTGHAIQVCEGKVKGRFIVINGDDLYAAGDLASLVRQERSILVAAVNNPENFGVCTWNKRRELTRIVEKPKSGSGKFANTGAYVLDENVFEALKKVKKTERGELEITSALSLLERMQVVKVEESWVPIGYPWNYLEANVLMLRKIKNFVVEGKIEKQVTLHGKVYVGKGSTVKSGTYIEGPVYIGKNCIIGPQAYIRKDTVLMDNVIFRGEVVDSVIMNNTTAKHSCYIGHSVIGEDVNVAAGTITSDYRHDGKDHTTIVRGRVMQTGRRKLGAFLGDGVRTGIGTLFYPGRKMGPALTTLPGEVVTKDKE